MQVALAYHAGDADQASRWLDWVRELGGEQTHHLFIMAARGAPAVKFFAEAPWASVQWVKDAYGIQSNWNGNPTQQQSASGPNSMLRQFAWFFEQRGKGPWMFVEPDAIPTRTGWLDELEHEYLASAKAYMGARIPAVPGQYQEHSTGNMILPQTAAYCEGLMMAKHGKFGDQIIEVAFDVAGAKDVLRHFHDTKLIQQIFRGEDFNTMTDLGRVNQTAALFHSDKKGGLIRLLREARTGFVHPIPTRAAFKPRVCTYFAPSMHEPTRLNQEKIVQIWKTNWSQQGWEPVVLTMDDAGKHPRYVEFRDAFARLPIKNPPEYEAACFARWVAMTTIGGGLIVDYDVLCNGFKIDQLSNGNLHVFCGHVPCATLASGEEYERWCMNFILGNVQSDMHALEARKQDFTSSLDCIEYGQPGWQQAKLIHFCHYACEPRPRCEVMKEWMERKVEPVASSKNLHCETTSAPSLAVREMTVSDHVNALVEFSKKDAFAKGRIVKQLRKSGLIK